LIVQANNTYSRFTRRGGKRSKKGGALFVNSRRAFTTPKKTLRKLVHNKYNRAPANYTKLLKNTLGMNNASRMKFNKINAKINISTNYDQAHYKYILNTCYNENTLSKDFFTVVTSIIPGSPVEKSILAEEFLYNIFNYITFIGETPLDDVILRELRRMSVNGFELSDLSLDEFKAKYEQMKSGIFENSRNMKNNNGAMTPRV
jgi:hypothetical protein